MNKNINILNINKNIFLDVNKNMNKNVLNIHKNILTIYIL